jgi:CheY-like chemotaxis protein
MDKIRCAILCIDDDPIILQMLQFQLKKHLSVEHIMMEFYTDPKDALSIIHDNLGGTIELILIIVDFQMNKMNGAELILNIASGPAELKCIMLSGQANDTVVNQLKSKNLLDAFILKPWRENELMDAILPILKDHNVL